MLQATLRQMADIALPPPVSMMPATWGWAVLAGLVVLVLVFALWLWLRRRAQNRYRREALAELAVLEATLSGETERRTALSALPAIIKRTALAVWPREEVAALNGQAWLGFLKSHADNMRIDAEDYAFLVETEYRLALAIPDKAEARRSFAAARQWIEGHNVHP
jgi:C4-dicarboxylate-specific signal transduction histidine kinase